jgi:hypothetical protein
MEKEKQVVACMPASTQDVLPGGDYSHSCARCGIPLVVARSTFGQMKEHGVTDPEFICLSCFLTDIKSGEEINITPPSEEQLKEVRTYINSTDPNVN